MLASPALPCVACAHSAASIPAPGAPSGERPCCFCIRNTAREAWLAEHNASTMHSGPTCKHPVHGYWYDGSKAAKPVQDNYHSVDYGNQVKAWLAPST